jgi:hypothetical protein
MVGALRPRDCARQIRRPLRLELAGPAGAGKSTLSQDLLRRLNATPGTIWGLPVPSLLGNGLRLIPTFVKPWIQSRSLLWDETRHMVRLETLHNAVRQATLPDDDVVIFDEGPIFSMAWLRGFGHETLRSPATTEWWQTTLHRWATLMDVVLVLDASDQLLARRIRQRPHWHEVKDLPDSEIPIWMARFREALNWVLAELTSRGGPAIVRLTIADEPLERTAERAIEALEENPRGR